HFRRRKPHCAGTLVWQLNDCWPVLSWALIDYHGFGKAAYHFVRRAYAPVLASFRVAAEDRKSTRLNSSHVAISYAVLCLKKKNDSPAEAGIDPRLLCSQVHTSDPAGSVISTIAITRL